MADAEAPPAEEAPPVQAPAEDGVAAAAGGDDGAPAEAAADAAPTDAAPTDAAPTGADDAGEALAGGDAGDDAGAAGGAVADATIGNADQPSETDALGVAVPQVTEAVYAANKKAILAQINAERKEAGVAALELDDEVSSAADAFCQDMIDGGYVSHYDTHGFKPYQRYFFKGCTHHVAENVAGYDAKDDKMFDRNEEPVQQQMADAHGEFMAQAEDGATIQKQNVLNPVHTHVGIGVACSDNAFRYCEVFVDKYVQLQESAPDGTAAPKLQFTSDETFIIVKSVREGYDVVGCTVFYEPRPRPMGADALNALDGYEDYTAEKGAVVWPWEMIRLDDGSLRVPIFLSQLRPGHYYTQVHVRGDVDSIPYNAPSEDLDITAPDVVTATGIVFTCSKAQVLGFEDAQKGHTGQKRPDEAEDAAAVPAGFSDPITDVTILIGPEPAGDGFRRQWSVADAAKADSAVAWVSSGESAPIISDAVLAASETDTPTPPEGYVAVATNLVPASAAAAGGDGAQNVFLCVKRPTPPEAEEGKGDGDEEAAPAAEPPLLDLALVFVPNGAPTPAVPNGYVRSDVVCIGGTIVLAKCNDEAAVKDVAAEITALAEGGEKADEEAAADDLGAAFEVAHGIGDEALEGGYEDGMDWRDADEDEGEMADAGEDYEDPEAEAERRRAERDRVYQMLTEARAERERLISVNHSIQRKLAVYFASRKPDDEKEAEAKSAAPSGPQAEAEKEKRYVDTLGNVNKARDDLEATRSSFDAIAMDLQSRLDEKEAKASEIQDAFVEFKREIAKAAENSRTGKPIPRRIIRQFEETERAKDTELEKVRLKNIHLRTQLRKLETRLKEKEQLADGLHLIDFEQLKIENQTLNEKIEERNEELHKLRKKTTTTVQVLTHIKEKLQFVQAEAGVLKRELGELEAQVTSERDSLSKAKHERDALRQENDKAKQQQGFVNSRLLVQDFRTRKADIKALKGRLEELRQRYTFLMAQATGGMRGTGAGSAGAF